MSTAPCPHAASPTSCWSSASSSISLSLTPVNPTPGVCTAVSTGQAAGPDRAGREQPERKAGPGAAGALQLQSLLRIPACSCKLTQSWAGCCSSPASWPPRRRRCAALLHAERGCSPPFPPPNGRVQCSCMPRTPGRPSPNGRVHCNSPRAPWRGAASRVGRRIGTGRASLLGRSSQISSSRRRRCLLTPDRAAGSDPPPACR